MPRRATARGTARTPLDRERADVLVCGASFAGLAVARELAGVGADVLLVDRYEIGERATSACAAPTPWIRAMGVESSARQEIPTMRFGTPHGAYRYELPWSWTAFDYRALCRALWEQSDARFTTATVRGRTGDTVHTDRGDVAAPLVVDTLGWRRVLGARVHQPPDSPISRGLEVHPEGEGDALDVWVDRALVRRGYGWSVPAAGEQRVGVGSYEPRDHVRLPTQALAGRYGRPPVRYQGNWFPHALRPAVEDGVFFAGDSAGHCLPLSGEGIRTAFYFGVACGRELRAVLAGRQSLGAALAAYAAFSERHRPAYRLLRLGQRIVPALPPRALGAVLRGCAHPAVVSRAFARYLAIAPPDFAAAGAIGESERPVQPDHVARRDAVLGEVGRIAALGREQVALDPPGSKSEALIEGQLAHARAGRPDDHAPDAGGAQRSAHLGDEP
jgi:menaquinone-9 beta-reductase